MHQDFRRVSSNAIQTMSNETWGEACGEYSFFEYKRIFSLAPIKPSTPLYK